MDYKKSTYRKHILGISGIIIMFVLYHLVINKINATTLENNRKDTYRGVLFELYRNEEDHNVLMMRIDTSGFRPLNRSADSWGISYENVDVGDSIIKLPDTLMIIVKKSSGKMKEFRYRNH